MFMPRPKATQAKTPESEASKVLWDKRAASMTYTESEFEAWKAKRDSYSFAPSGRSRRCFQVELWANANLPLPTTTGAKV